MPKYHIFGSSIICLDINLKSNNISVSMEEDKSNIDIPAFKKELENLLKYFEQLEKWNKVGNVVISKEP